MFKVSKYSPFLSMMKRVFTAYPTLLPIFLLTLAACKPENEPTTTPFDHELQQALVRAGGDLNFFKLPAPTDYASIPQDPKNPLTPQKVELGKFLYHETGLAVNPTRKAGQLTYSCASCHHVDAGFQACVPQGIGEGGVGFGKFGENRVKDAQYKEHELDVQPIRSPSVLHVAYQPNMLWNGQFGATGVNIGTEASWTPGTPRATNRMGFEGVETQAIAGMGVHRLAPNAALFRNSTYRQLFERAYPTQTEPNRYTVEHIALAIAAYERTLLATEAPFQQWLKGRKGALTDNQKQGALLFFGKANCVACHTGPALNSMAFYALGMPDLTGSRTHNIHPGQPEHLGRGGFTGKTHELFQFKVPQLYNLRDSPFMGHGGNFRTVREVITYKNRAIPANPRVPQQQLAREFVPLRLSAEEINQLTDFVENGLHDPNLKRYTPTLTPSGHCFPNNDLQTRVDISWFGH